MKSIKPILGEVLDDGESLEHDSSFSTSMIHIQIKYDYLRWHDTSLDMN